MRWVITLAVYLVALLLTAAAAWFLVLLLAGPHAGLLPSFLEVTIIVMAWLLVLLLPVLAARAAWRRHARRKTPLRSATTFE